MKTIVVLGSTGSIGQNALLVCRRFPERLRVVGLSAYNNGALLATQARLFQPEWVAIVDKKQARTVKDDLPTGTRLLVGEEGIVELAQMPEADLVLNAIVGSAGLLPSLAVLAAGKTLALANKESLVMAGELLMVQARVNNVEIFPIDSEHSAIKQCLFAGRHPEVRRIILTASGGPFREKSRDEFAQVTVNQALAHPTWNMGKKVTIDSATLMNKGLEIIEAHHLFGMPQEKIEVAIHPQSLVHSLVEFVDGSVLAQISPPDMKIPLQYALLYPERLSSENGLLDLTRTGTLEFSEPDLTKFPSLLLARRALTLGGTAPAVLNAADEVAVQAFLDEKIGFGEIPQVVRAVLDEHTVIDDPTLDDILKADRWAKSKAGEFVGITEEAAR